MHGDVTVDVRRPARGGLLGQQRGGDQLARGKWFSWIPDPLPDRQVGRDIPEEALRPVAWCGGDQGDARTHAKT